MESSGKQYQVEPIRIVTTRNNEVVRIFEIKKGDAWNICNFVVANEHRLLDFFPGTREQNLTPELSEIFVNTKVKQFLAKEEYLFTLRRKDSHSVIGLVYIKELDWIKKQGEFAYAIDYNYEGKGITSKVIEALSLYAFEELKLEVLQIIAHETNVSSRKVAEKNGFRWIKTLPKVFTPRGREPMDMELYELYK